MVVPVPGIWSYVKEGVGWIGRFATEGSEAAADYLDPSKIKERTREQAEALLRGGPSSPVMPEPSTIPDILPESVKKYGKYAKYALIGGGVLLAYRILKK